MTPFILFYDLIQTADGSLYRVTGAGAAEGDYVATARRQQQVGFNLEDVPGKDAVRLFWRSRLVECRGGVMCGRGIFDPTPAVIYNLFSS